MKAGWQIKKLGEVCQTGAGGTPLKMIKEYYDGGTIPWLLSGEVSQGEIRAATNFITQKGLDNSSAKIFPKDTVLVAMYGATAGQVGILRFAAATNQAICGILPNKQFIPEFLFYLLLSKKNELVAQAAGNAQPNISQIKIRNIDVPIVSLPEQQRLVRILDEAFEGIATATANAEKNLRNARALFEGHLEAVFRQRGEGWEEKPLGNLASFRNGVNYTKDSKGECIKIVGVRNFQQNFWVPLDDLGTVTIDSELSELDILKQDDILAVRSNGNIELIGRCMLTGEVSEKASHSGFTIRIRLSTGEVLPRFFCHFMKSASSRKRLTDGGIGTNIKSLNQGMLSVLAVPFPSVSMQKVLVEKLETLAEETQRLESIYRRKLAALEALKKSLLHQAFNGEL